jgi:hypothetical protein
VRLMAIRKLIIDDSMDFREGPDGISMAGYFFSISASRSQVLNRSFDGVEMSHSGLDRRSSFGPDHTGAVEGSFRDSADFVEKFPDFNFQLSPTFLQAIHDIRLDACTFISIKYSRNSLASRSITPKACTAARNTSQRRCGQRNAKQLFKRES